jgi:hypothetical protein
MPIKRKLKKPRKRSAGGKLANAKLPTVRVRMYRQGLGDCFLLTFNPGTNQATMLIDFGSLGSASPLASMEDVMSNIESETGKHLNLLIATHEHQDHVSGFRTFKERFKKFKVDNVWLAWAEDETDELTRKLGKPQDIALALAASARALLACKDTDNRAHALGEAVQGLLTFAGEFGASDLARTVDEAMDFVRDAFVPPRRPLKPGDPPLEEPWLPGFRFYILGPPHSETALKDLGDDGDPRLYGLQGLAAAASMQLNDAGNAQATEREMPFEARFRRTESDVGMALVIGSYLAEESKWRRVDSEWLYTAAEFALQFDTFINNTSLALAIERIADGKVLLFPGDAQVGNWESWQPLTWTVKKPDGSTQAVTTKELLNRTVFYKAGHHASHNGTAKASGLVQMKKQSELITFIPLDRPKALNHNPPWKMPAQALYSQLLESSNGRVVRSDIGWALDPSTQTGVEAELGPIGTPQTWAVWNGNQLKAEQDGLVKIQPKWIDFTLS